MAPKRFFPGGVFFFSDPAVPLAIQYVFGYFSKGVGALSDPAKKGPHISRPAVLFVWSRFDSTQPEGGSGPPDWFCLNFPVISGVFQIFINAPQGGRFNLRGR